MFCEQCGTKVEDGFSNCPNCNNLISSNHSVPIQDNSEAFTQEVFHQQDRVTQGQQSYHEQQPYQSQQPNQSQSFQNSLNGTDINNLFNTILAKFKEGIQPDRIMPKLIAYIGLVIALISTFLPTYTVSVTFITKVKQSVSFNSYSGPWVLLLILIAAGLLICNYDKIATIVTGLAGILVVLSLFKFLFDSQEYLSDIANTSISIGFILLVVGLLLEGLYFFLPILKQKKIIK